MLRITQRQKPLFLIICGDMVAYDGERDWRFFLKVLDEGHPSVPVFLVAGNHEWNQRQGRRCDAKTNVLEQLIGRTYYWFSYGENLFVVLDNGRQPIERDADQWRWLVKLLKERGRLYRNIFVFMHIPPFPVSLYEAGSSAREDHYRRFRELMASHGVKVVFSGHSHRYLELSDGGVRYYISSGAGQRLDNGKQHHFLDVRVEGTTVSVARVDIGCNHFSIVDPIFYEIVIHIYPALGFAGWIAVALCCFIGGVVLLRLGGYPFNLPSRM